MTLLGMLYFLLLIIVRYTDSDNHENNISVLAEGPTDDINDSFGAVEQKFNINFSKTKSKFCLSLHYNSDSSYIFVNLPTQFCLGSIGKMHILK